MASSNTPPRRQLPNSIFKQQSPAGAKGTNSKMSGGSPAYRAPKLLYNFLRIEDEKKRTRALIIVSESRDEKRSTQKYLKINRWVGTLQNLKISELANFQPFTDIMRHHHAKLFHLQNNGTYLQHPWSVLFADDLELDVDCDDDFGIHDPKLSDVEFYNLWQPKALDSILEEIIKEVGEDLCAVRTVPVDKEQTVFLSLQLLREEWTLPESLSFVPFRERQKLKAKTPATKTPAARMSFAERIKIRKFTPHPGLVGDILDEDKKEEEQDEAVIETAFDGTKIKIEAPTDSAFEEGTNSKVEGAEEEVATDTSMTKEPVTVIAQVSSATPAAKKAKKGGQQ